MRHSNSLSFSFNPLNDSTEERRRKKNLKNIDMADFTLGTKVFCGFVLPITCVWLRCAWLLSDGTQVVRSPWLWNIANSRETPFLPCHFILVTV